MVDEDIFDDSGEGAGAPFTDKPLIKVRGLNVHYGEKHAVHSVNFDINPNEVTAMIGPSGCGKTTILRCFNRMSDAVKDCRVEGEILVDGRDVRDPSVDVVDLRMRIGMVFQKPNPFPKSIYDNVAYGPRLHGAHKTREELDELVHACLKKAGLYDEVKNRLMQPGTNLSGGQQQRLCIARAIAIEPQIVLMDEPCSALDPIASARIEELMHELKEKYTIIIVTHSMQQAARVSQRTAYFHLGRLVEADATDKLFTNPQHRLTENYISGRFG